MRPRTWKTCSGKYCVILSRHEQAPAKPPDIKVQATIPVEVRRALRLRPGDRVAFELKKGTVTLRRADTLDRAFLKLAEMAFEEWNSPEDEAAFRDL